MKIGTCKIKVHVWLGVIDSSIDIVHFESY